MTLAGLKWFRWERSEAAPPRASVYRVPTCQRRVLVPHVYSIIHRSAFPPETVTMMGEVFERAWASIEPQYEKKPDTETE